MVTNAAGDVTSLLGKTIAYDTAGRVSQVTAIPPCPSGLNCLSQQATLSRYNGHNQRFLRETDQGQTVFVYGPDGYSVLFESEHRLVDATTVSTTTETIYLPTGNGPMPVVAVINGAPYAIHADHLNTPRRLTDAQGQPRWQWPFSGFGEQAPQTIPAAGQPAIRFSLRYPGQVDDGYGLFYNFNRFYDPLAGRYTNADPIGLDGGWNRFAYVGGNALGAVDPEGLMGNNPRATTPGFNNPPNPATAGPFGCIGLSCLSWSPGNSGTQMSLELTFGDGIEFCNSPPPPPQICERNPPSGFQPPGIPVPKRFGGVFFGPSIKMNGQKCLRIGPHVSAPIVPSAELGDLW